jgi:hypothetical protein
MGSRLELVALLRSRADLRDRITRQIARHRLQQGLDSDNRGALLQEWVNRITDQPKRHQPEPSV